MRKLLVGMVILVVSSMAWCGAWCGEEAKIFEGDKTLQRDTKRIAKKMKREDEKLAEAQKKHKKAIAKFKMELVKTYEASMKRYTKKGDLRTANAILAQIDKIKEDTQEEVLDIKGEKNGVLYVCCDDICKVSLNGKIIMASSDGNWKNVLEKEITLKKGDIISVMAANSQNARGFSAVFVPHDGKPRMVSDNTWKTYRPKTEEWWKFKPSKSDKLASNKGTNQSTASILSLKTNVGIKIDSIWGNEASCYLYRVISSKDIK